MTAIARDRNDHLAVSRLRGENFLEAVTHVEELITRLLIKKVVRFVSIVESSHGAAHEVFPLRVRRIALRSDMLALEEVVAGDAAVARAKVSLRRDGATELSTSLVVILLRRHEGDHFIRVGVIDESLVIVVVLPGLHDRLVGESSEVL